MLYKMSNESAAAIEFLVEPFVAGSPGPHVDAAIDALAAHGIEAEVGPFASSATGDPKVLATAIADLTRDALAAGATRLRIRFDADADATGSASTDTRDLHSALDDMVAELRERLGPAEDWSRRDKQEAVRVLADRGAFLLRGAVEDVAAVMGVSRITIYNYLNAIDGARD